MYKRILALSLAIYLSLYPVTTFANEEGSIDNVIDLGGDKKSLDEAEEMPDSSYSEEEESPEESMNEEIEEQPVDDEV